MSKIWEFYDTMDELVYVSDVDSHELVYMNKKALLTYGLHSLHELAGKKCYEILQNNSIPCPICNNRKLQEGYFIEQRQYDPALERHFLRKDTLLTENGKKYRMTLAFDIDNLGQINSLIRELEQMSYRDQLTGIGNRHAMNRYLDNLEAAQSLGIVYCDITGLKQTNDQKGHDWGDKLIIDACSCLQKSFGEYGLFRIGGDELLALCTPIEESALWQGIERLRKNLRKKSVHMAVGGLWERTSFCGVGRLIAEAERRMYQDKADYYRKHGTDRRHPIETVSSWI